MKRYERLELILNHILSNESVSIEDITEKLAVSAATARRDLDALAAQQLIMRTRGGARANPTSAELPLRYKSVNNAEAKYAIARAAAKLVKPGDVIALNGGTTTSEIAHEIALLPPHNDNKGQRRLTIVTNAINIANELTVRPHLRVMVTGGVVRSRSYELTGPMADLVLGHLSVNTLFLGVNGFHSSLGAFASHEGEASTNAALTRCAQKVVVVADATKLEHTAFARICRTKQVNTLITDTNAPTDVINKFIEAGVEVIVASNNGDLRQGETE